MCVRAIYIYISLNVLEETISSMDRFTVFSLMNPDDDGNDGYNKVEKEDEEVHDEKHRCARQLVYR